MTDMKQLNMNELKDAFDNYLDVEIHVVKRQNAQKTSIIEEYVEANNNFFDHMKSLRKRIPYMRENFPDTWSIWLRTEIQGFLKDRYRSVEPDAVDYLFNHVENIAQEQ